MNSFYLVNIIFFTLGLLGKILFGDPVDMYSNYSVVKYVSVFFSFSFWFFSLLSWGNVIRSFLKLNNWIVFLNLLIGTIFYIFIPICGGVFKFFGKEYSFIYFGISILGVFLNCIINKNKKNLMRKTNLIFNKLDIIIIICIVSIFILVIVQSFFLNTLQDVYYYHLYSPKHWWNNSTLNGPSYHPMVLQSTYWEMIYIWPFAIFSSYGSFGLVSVQLFSQMIHAFVGFGGTSLALYYLFKKFFSKKLNAIGSVMLAVIVPNIFWTSWYAKNDYGACFFLVFFINDSF